MDRHVTEILEALVAGEPRLRPVGRRLVLQLPLTFVLNLLRRILAVTCSPQMQPEHLVAGADRLARRIERLAGAVDSPAACRHFVEQRVAPLFGPQVVYHALPLVLVGIGSRFLVEWLLRRWLDDPAALQPVLRSLPHNPTMEMDLELWRISRVLASEGREPSADHPAVQDFLARYGHRGIREIDAGMPRWREEPEHVLEVLRTYLSHEEGADPERQFREGERAAEEAARRLVERVRRGEGAAA